MKKIKLGICIGDEEYQKRFVKCWINHYKSQYELYVFKNLEEILVSEERKYEVILVEDVSVEQIEQLVKSYETIICLMEGEGSYEVSRKNANIRYLEKFQEVYKIESQVKQCAHTCEKSLGDLKSENSKNQIVGIYSLDCESYQIPFAAMAAMEFGEKANTLVISLQAFSGLLVNEEINLENSENLGLEDLMAVATIGGYTEARLWGGIGHEQNWDYVYPAKNSECLAEVNREIYEGIINILIKELGYQVIILNFGTVFPGMFELMDRCDEFYFLVPKGNGTTWREMEFKKETIRRGKEDFFHRITRIEIPAFFGSNIEWKKLSHQWRWGNVGDRLRKHMWMEGESG